MTDQNNPAAIDDPFDPDEPKPDSFDEWIFCLADEHGMDVLRQVLDELGADWETLSLRSGLTLQSRLEVPHGHHRAQHQLSKQKPMGALSSNYR